MNPRDKPSADDRSRLPSRLSWLIATVYFFALAVVGLWLWQSWGGALTVRLVDRAALLAGVLFAAGCAGWAARCSHGRARRGWWAMTAGLLSWAVAELIWSYYEVALARDLAPTPSWADAFYLLYVLGAAIAVTNLSTAETRRARVRLILDGLLVAACMFLVLWVSLADSVFHEPANSRFSLAVSLLYPVANVVIIAIAWESAVVAYRPSLRLMVGGLIVIVACAGVFTAMTAVDGYHTGSLINLGWLAGCGLLGLAALRAIGESPRVHTRAAIAPRTRTWLPYPATVIAGIVVSAKIVPGLGSVPLVAVVLVLIPTLLARQFIVMTENQRLLSDVGRLAFTDQLTGLASRALFQDRLEKAVMRQAHEPLTLTVLCLDLDGFKAVNDELGHPAGDELLIQVAHRISANVRSDDTVARLGGDEFAILLEGRVEDSVEIADRILAAFDGLIVVDGVPLTVRPSIGLTLATADMPRTSVSSLIRQADLAMYAAKRDGGACLRSFVPELPNPYELPKRLVLAVGSQPTVRTDALPTDARDRATRQRREALPAQPRWPPRRARIALFTLLAGVVVFASFMLLRDRPKPTALIDYGMNSALLLSAAALVAARSWRGATERWSWRFIAAGMAASGLATVVYGAFVPTGQGPSIADPLFAAFYPLVFTGLALLIRQRLRYVPRVVSLDAVVVGLTVAALAAALASGPIEPAMIGEPASLFIRLGYPAGGLLALGIASGSLAVLGVRSEKRWVLLIAGIVFYAVANAVYLFQSLHGTYVKGTWIDASWPIAFFLIAAAAWAPNRHAGMRPLTGRASLLPPMVCTVVAVGVTLLAEPKPVPVTLAAVSLIAIAARLLMTFRDVSALADNHHQATTDELTGLANRLAVATALTAGAYDGSGRANRRGATLGLVLLALDQFEEIADSLGPEATDDLRYRIADRLAGAVDAVNLFARVSDDEFAVVIGQADLAAGRAQAVALLEALNAPFALDQITVQVEASIGISLWPNHCDHPQELLACAEAAMAHARGTTGHIAVYDAMADVSTNSDGHFIADLRNTLASTAPGELPAWQHSPDPDLAAGELTCHYQPKIRAVDDSVHSVEALVRWRHPTRGLLLPDQFLPAAEHAGLMRPLTARVLDLALAQLRAWRDDGIELTVAVNLSSTNLLDLGLVETIARLLGTYDLPAESLILEITESTLTTDSIRARNTVSALRRLGARLSLDDYGTGWSSLARLQDLSVDELKLDRVFVARLARDPRSIAIVRSTVALAHSLSADLVAEGVENDATLHALRQYGCNITQGNVHSPALPPEEFRRWIRARSPTLA